MNIIYQLGLPGKIFIYTTTNCLQSWQGMKELFLYLVCYLSAVYYIRNGWFLFDIVNFAHNSVWSHHIHSSYLLQIYSSGL